LEASSGSPAKSGSSGGSSLASADGRSGHSIDVMGKCVSVPPPDTCCNIVTFHVLTLLRQFNDPSDQRFLPQSSISQQLCAFQPGYQLFCFAIESPDDYFAASLLECALDHYRLVTIETLR
jgi:hypothetical protein